MFWLVICPLKGLGMLLDVIDVQVMPKYVLELKFENGERRRFDMAPFMDEKPWTRIKGAEVFAQAYCHLGTVTWPGNVDIDPETLYERSIPLESHQGKAA